MDDKAFYLECPEFNLECSDSVSPVANRLNYAHPVDSKIIQMLDLPGVKSVFGSAVDMITDLNFSPIISSGIPVNGKNFPEINDIVDHCASSLGIKRPYVVISSAVELNAFTVGSDEEAYIVLGNVLVRVMDAMKLKFIVGHECGHIAMGHVVYHSIVSTAAFFTNAIPIIGHLVYGLSSFALAAWSRRSEITADRAGLMCCLNPDEAKKALLQLQSGFISAEKIDADSYVSNSNRYRNRGFLRRVNEFARNHPLLAKRIEALDMFAKSEPYYLAQGLQAPSGCMSMESLTKSVEKIIAVMGDD